MWGLAGGGDAALMLSLAYYRGVEWGPDGCALLL